MSQDGNVLGGTTAKCVGGWLEFLIERAEL